MTRCPSSRVRGRDTCVCPTLRYLHSVWVISSLYTSTCTSVDSAAVCTVGKPPQGTLFVVQHRRVSVQAWW